MQKLRCGLFIFVFFTLLGCSTLSKQQCQSMDWQERGRVDGSDGKPSSTVSTYGESCEEHGIQIDGTRYEQGRRQGLKVFCDYESGRAYGAEGKKYLSVCPEELEGNFLRGYRLGLKEYELAKREQELRDQEAKIREREANIANRLSAHNANSCTFNSDCKIKRSCTFSKCENTGAACSFDSDCEIEGRCRSDSEYIDGQRVSFNKCEY